MSTSDPYSDPLTALLAKDRVPAEEALTQPSEDHARWSEWMSFDGIRHFFEDCNFDLYSKEYFSPESYRVAGEPCHGGYAYENSATKVGEDNDAGKL